LPRQHWRKKSLWKRRPEWQSMQQIKCPQKHRLLDEIIRGVLQQISYRRCLFHPSP
jgi:hypothetical protein